MESNPDIALFYDEDISSDLFDGFERLLHDENISVRIESKPKEGPFACAEWFVPTVVAIFIGKSYFDGFLKEAGKDHYSLLKTKISGLANKVMTRPKIEPIILGTQGKLLSHNPYSLAFSIYAEANDGNRFKLLVPKPPNSADYTKIVCKFLDFLEDYHAGLKSLEDIGYEIGTKPIAGHIFLHLNPETEEIEWVDERLYR